MALDIVYGYQGKDHVKASQLARLLSGTIGEGRYVLGTQNKMAASMQTANKVRIQTGDLVMDGRYITNEAYQDLMVDSGQSGYKRNDLVGVQYTRASGSDADHAVETVSLVVKKGTQTTGTATDPSYTAGDISAGDASAFYPLWRLPINGLTVGTPVKLFEEAQTVSDLRDSISQTQSGDWTILTIAGKKLAYRAFTMPKVQGTQIDDVATSIPAPFDGAKIALSTVQAGGGGGYYSDYDVVLRSEVSSDGEYVNIVIMRSSGSSAFLPDMAEYVVGLLVM